MLSNYKSKKCTPQGFTLIEVMISIAIIVLVSTLIMLRYGAFSSSVLLKNQAFEVALDIRETQSYATSVRGSGNEFRQEYGLRFSSVSSINSQYTFFLDSQDSGGSDRLYNSGEELGEPRRLDRRFIVSRICSPDCVNPASNEIYSYLDLTYKRPDFDALLRGYRSGAGWSTLTNVEIEIASVADPSKARRVYVSSTGQIEVK